MNKNGPLIIFLVIVALAGIGYLVVKQTGTTTAPNATSTPPIVTPPGNTGNNAPQAAAPVATTNSSAAVSNSTAVVSGTVKPNGAQTTYWFEYGETTSFGTQNSAQTLGSGFATIPTPAYITGLKASTLYYFRLNARNAFGTSQGAMFSFTTHATNPPPVGNAPTTKTNAATDISRTTANLNGRANPNGSATSYWFEYGTTQDLGRTTALQLAGSGTATLDVSVSLSDLEAATKYYFRLNAQNEFGTVNGAILSFTTSGPPAPARPSVNTKSATNIATSSAMFRGAVTPNGADTTYWFEYSVDNLLGSIIGTTTPEQSAGSGYAEVDVEASVSGLAPNTKYFFRLAARNTFGTVRGDVMTFKTRP